MTEQALETATPKPLLTPPGSLTPDELSKYRKITKLVRAWCDDIDKHCLELEQSGIHIPEHKLVAGRASRVFGDRKEVADVLRTAGYADEDIFETKMLSVAQIEKLLGKKEFRELLEGHVVRIEGKPTLAHESDRRKALTLDSDDFEDLDAVDDGC